MWFSYFALYSLNIFFSYETREVFKVCKSASPTMDRSCPNNNKNNDAGHHNSGVPMSGLPSEQYSSNQSTPGPSSSSQSSWSPGSSFPGPAQYQSSHHGAPIQQNLPTTHTYPQNNSQNHSQVSASPRNHPQLNTPHQQAQAVPQDNNSKMGLNKTLGELLQDHHHSMQLQAARVQAARAQAARAQAAKAQATGSIPTPPRTPAQRTGYYDVAMQGKSRTVQPSLVHRTSHHNQPQRVGSRGGSRVKHGISSRPGPYSHRTNRTQSLRAQEKRKASSRKQSRSSALPPHPANLRSVDWWSKIANERRSEEADSPQGPDTQSSQPPDIESYASIFTQTYAYKPEYEVQSELPCRWIRNIETGKVDCLKTISVDPDTGTRITRYTMGGNSRKFEPRSLNGNRVFFDSQFKDLSVYNPVIGSHNDEGHFERKSLSPVMSRLDLPRGPLGPDPVYNDPPSKIMPANDL